MSERSQAVCWVVTAGAAGMENQCLGLAEALGYDPVVKRVKLKFPWKQFSPFFRKGLRWAFDPSGDSVAPPWPELIIASGRVGAMACLYARRAAMQAGQKVWTVHIQNPVIDPSRFDLVAVPRHDGLIGEHIITTRGSLHRVTASRIRSEAERVAADFSGLPSPRFLVAIGGSNAVYQLTPSVMLSLVQGLKRFTKNAQGSLMITASRRTDAASMDVLREGLAGTPHMIWDGQGSNPYYGMMGLADGILVTEDSVNMTSEACATGKPVYILPLPGGSDKFRRFHQTLRDDGMTRIFDGSFEPWTYAPLNDVQLVADRIRRMMQQ